MQEGEQSLPLHIVDTVEKQLLLDRASFEGAEPIFHQKFWLDPRMEFSRHRHPVMKELIGVVDGELEVVVQETVDGLVTVHVLTPGEVLLITENYLHTLRNPSGNKLEAYAMGFILAEGGITVRE